MPTPVSATVRRTYFRGADPIGMFEPCSPTSRTNTVPSVSVPPRGIASRAFTARFMMTWWSNPGSARTEGRSAARRTSTRMSSPMTRFKSRAVSVTISLRFTGEMRTSRLRLKVSSCPVRAAARSPARRMSSVSSTARCDSPSVSAASNSAQPLMTVRRLLKSWAIPPASRPTASSFAACRSCCSSLAFSSYCRAISAAARQTRTRSVHTHAPPTSETARKPPPKEAIRVVVHHEDGGALAGGGGSSRCEMASGPRRNTPGAGAVLPSGATATGTPAISTFEPKASPARLF